MVKKIVILVCVVAVCGVCLFFSIRGIETASRGSADFNSRFAEHERKLELFTGKLAELRSATDSIKQQTADIRTEYQRLPGEIQRVRKSIEGDQGRISAVVARLEKVSKGLVNLENYFNH